MMTATRLLIGCYFSGLNRVFCGENSQQQGLAVGTHLESDIAPNRHV